MDTILFRSHLQRSGRVFTGIPVPAVCSRGTVESRAVCIVAASIYLWCRCRDWRAGSRASNGDGLAPLLCKDHLGTIRAITKQWTRSRQHRVFEVADRLRWPGHRKRYARPIAKTDCKWCQLQHAGVGQTSVVKQSLQLASGLKTEVESWRAAVPETRREPDLNSRTCRISTLLRHSL